MIKVEIILTYIEIMIKCLNTIDHNFIIEKEKNGN